MFTLMLLGICMLGHLCMADISNTWHDYYSGSRTDYACLADQDPRLMTCIWYSLLLTPLFSRQNLRRRSKKNYDLRKQ